MSSTFCTQQRTHTHPAPPSPVLPFALAPYLTYARSAARTESYGARRVAIIRRITDNLIQVLTEEGAFWRYQTDLSDPDWGITRM